MGAQVAGEGQKYLFVRANKGKLYFKSDEHDKRATMESYEDNDKVTHKIYKVFLWNISGKIVSCDIAKNEKINATQLILVLDDGSDELVKLTTKPGTFTSDFLINQLMKVDIGKTIEISTSADKETGKYTTFWVKYPDGDKGEWVGLKYSKKAGNQNEIPEAGTTEDPDTGEEKKDWTPVHSFYSRWFREDFKPMVEKLANDNIAFTEEVGDEPIVDTTPDKIDDKPVAEEIPDGDLPF